MNNMCNQLSRGVVRCSKLISSTLSFYHVKIKRILLKFSPPQEKKWVKDSEWNRKAITIKRIFYISELVMILRRRLVVQAKNGHESTNNWANSWNISRWGCHSCSDPTAPDQLEILTCTNKNTCSNSHSEYPSSSQYYNTTSYSNANPKNDPFLQLIFFMLMFWDWILLKW